jgi:hypothetical protein
MWNFARARDPSASDLSAAFASRESSPSTPSSVVARVRWFVGTIRRKFFRQSTFFPSRTHRRVGVKNRALVDVRVARETRLNAHPTARRLSIKSIEKKRASRGSTRGMYRSMRKKFDVLRTTPRDVMVDASVRSSRVTDDDDDDDARAHRPRNEWRMRTTAPGVKKHSNFTTVYPY